MWNLDNENGRKAKKYPLNPGRIPGLRLILASLTAIYLSASGFGISEASDDTKLEKRSSSDEVEYAISEATSQSDSAFMTTTDGETLKLTLESAILQALDNNVSFQIDRLEPEISRTREILQKSVFDASLTASAGASESRTDTEPEDGSKTSSDMNTDYAGAGLSKLFSPGTAVNLDLDYTASSTENGTDSDSEELSWDVAFTQALLLGRGMNVNLAQVRQAELDTEISLYELKGAAESLAAQTERAYWDYILAERSIDIYQKSLELARRRIDEVKERILVGQLAETELAAFEAEAAGRMEQLINAEGNLAKKRLNLIRILNLNDKNSNWDQKIDLIDAPELKPLELDTVESHVKTAMMKRPDLNQARLLIKKREVELVRTKNGLLPKLDLFLNLGGSAYSDSFSGQDDSEGDEFQAGIGVNLEFPLQNRQATAQRRQSLVSYKQTELALKNMVQLVQVDVRTAYVDVQKAEEQIKAARATRIFRQKTLDAENEKFQVGKSTAFLAAQSQRDLVASQINEISAIIEYRKALLELFRLEGSFLERKGLNISE